MKKKQVKENPLFNNSKEIKMHGFNSDEEDNLVKKFIIIVLVIALLAVIIYFVSEIFKKDTETNDNEVQAGVIDYSVVSVGTILNRPYDNYYVMVYPKESDDAFRYSMLISSYTNKEDAKKIYFCDLDNALNKEYYNVNNDNISNPKAKKISEFDFGDATLLEIKNGEIVNYIEDYTTIQEKLK